MFVFIFISDDVFPKEAPGRLGIIVCFEISPPCTWKKAKTNTVTSVGFQNSYKIRWVKHHPVMFSDAKRYWLASEQDVSQIRRHSDPHPFGGLGWRCSTRYIFPSPRLLKTLHSHLQHPRANRGSRGVPRKARSQALPLGNVWLAKIMAPKTLFPIAISWQIILWPVDWLSMACPRQKHNHAPVPRWGGPWCAAARGHPDPPRRIPLIPGPAAPGAGTLVVTSSLECPENYYGWSGGNVWIIKQQLVIIWS